MKALPKTGLTLEKAVSIGDIILSLTRKSSGAKQAGKESSAFENVLAKKKLTNKTHEATPGPVEIAAALMIAGGLRETPLLIPPVVRISPLSKENSSPAATTSPKPPLVWKLNSALPDASSRVLTGSGSIRINIQSSPNNVVANEVKPSLFTDNIWRLQHLPSAGSRKFHQTDSKSPSSSINSMPVNVRPAPTLPPANAVVFPEGAGVTELKSAISPRLSARLQGLPLNQDGSAPIIARFLARHPSAALMTHITSVSTAIPLGKSVCRSKESIETPTVAKPADNPPAQAVASASVGRSHARHESDVSQRKPGRQSGKESVAADKTAVENPVAKSGTSGTAPANVEFSSALKQTFAPPAPLPSYVSRPAPSLPALKPSELINGVRLTLSQGGGVLLVQLKPEILGQALVKLHMEDGKLKLDFSVERESARATLQAEVAHLREALTAAGFSDVNIEVHISPRHSFSPDDFSDKTFNRRSSEGAFSSEVEESETDLDPNLASPLLLGYNTFDLFA